MPFPAVGVLVAESQAKSDCRRDGQFRLIWCGLGATGRRRAGVIAELRDILDASL
ncbi:hypothetical protein [Pelagibacterium halotolerans]|uniref:hypothetical protein n=1 Tax=Pelagibacterium halotolerans TaxID=531813 RepID=UPI00384FE160